MPHLNATGPEGQGSGTGRNLGNCRKEASETNDQTVLGIGQGKKRNSNGGNGKRKRLKYNQNQ
ncbi:MAG: DUF5320 domain-containing protein [Bacteroidales bacterium]|nr:DUF5320 domain-containing protein [Bacteroidales bacterium]